VVTRIRNRKVQADGYQLRLQNPEAKVLLGLTGRSYGPVKAMERRVDALDLSFGNYAPVKESCWYAVSTRSRHEKVAAMTLGSLGIVHFLPLLDEKRKWSDRKTMVSVPLFPGYLFVQIPRTVESRLSVQKVPGLVNFVGNHNGPLAIPESELDSVRIMLSRGNGCSLHPFLQAGDRVRVVRGALVGLEGTFMRHGAQSKLVISVEMIQRSVSVNVPPYDVEPVSNTSVRPPQSHHASVNAEAAN
jgi:transcription antitermination factor NusG